MTNQLSQSLKVSKKPGSKDAISCRDYLMENELPAVSKFLIDEPPQKKSCLKDLVLMLAVFENRNYTSLRK